MQTPNGEAPRLKQIWLLMKHLYVDYNAASKQINMNIDQNMSAAPGN